MNGSQEHHIRVAAWNHRRGLGALKVAAAEFTATTSTRLVVHWIPQSLKDFGHGSIPGDADVVLIDHPCISSLYRNLLPIESTAVEDLLDMLEDVFPNAVESYRYKSALWAIPFDASCQVATIRTDKLKQLTDVTGIASSGTNLWCTLLSLVNAGQDTTSPRPGTPWSATSLARHTDHLIEAIESLTRICATVDPRHCDQNAADLVEDLFAGGSVIRRIESSFAYRPQHSAPIEYQGFGPNNIPGVLGGAGLAITSHCSDPSAAAALIGFCAQEAFQEQLMAHGGMPARSGSWAQSGRAADGVLASLIAVAPHRDNDPSTLALQETGSRLLDLWWAGALSTDGLSQSVRRAVADAAEDRLVP